MSNQYIVRQPIKDASKAIVAYEILVDGGSDTLYNQSNDRVAADAISSFLLQNNDKIFDDKLTFMTFTPNLLFKNTPRIFKEKDLVIQIEDNVIVHPLAFSLVQKYRREGYKVALNDFHFAPRYFSLMEHTDYIKIDFSDVNLSSAENIVRMAKGLNKKCVATGIANKEIYDKALGLGVDLFQGQYIAENLATKARKTDYLQSNFFNLVVAVTREEPNVEEIEEIISRDAALTYGILKIVNSVYFALRYRTSSVRQAIVTLGLGQLKQWVYLLSFKDTADEGAEEFLKLSFLRATFCSDLFDYIDSMPISKSEAYLMGMFSTLGHLIDAPLEEILNEIPVSEEIKNALLNHDGICGMLYDLVLSYEKADWKSITTLAELLDIPTASIAQIYFNCVEEVNNIWNNLTNPNPNADSLDSLSLEEPTERAGQAGVKAAVEFQKEEMAAREAAQDDESISKKISKRFRE